MPTILEKLLADGYKTVPISQMIMTNNYTINHEGRQIANTTTAAVSTTNELTTTKTTKKS